MSRCETQLYFTLFLCFKEGRRQSSPLHAPLASACGVEYLLDLQTVPKSHSRVLAGCWKSALDAHQTTLLPCPGTCRSICAHTRTNPRHHSQILATETDSEGPEKPAVHPGPAAGFAASAAEYRWRPGAAAWPSEASGRMQKSTPERSKSEREEPMLSYHIHMYVDLQVWL